MEVISHKEALERGLKRYFTGKPCKHGHVCERSVSSYGCLECARRASAAYYKSKFPAKEIGPRQKAMEKGLRHYFTGKPCKHGHVCARLVSTSVCLECARLVSARRRAEKPEEARKASRKWLENNREKSRAMCRRYHATHLESIRTRKRKWNAENLDALAKYARTRRDRKASEVQTHTVMAMLASSSKLKGL